MAEPEDERVVSSNDALTIRLGDAEFHPVFTYPIYGEQELIYGYDNPEIVLEFDPKTLQAVATFEHEGETPSADAKDPLKTLLEFTSADTFTERAKWQAAQAEQAEQAIPGVKFADLGNNFSVYKATVGEARTLLERFRIFVLLFIEGGSYIDEEDDAWELYLVYREDKFVGFATVYPYFWYENGPAFDATPADVRPVRKRISQFVILPPFQHQGVGKRLYDALISNFIADPRVRQIAVEDPNEAFDDLRDRCDIERLEEVPSWQELDLPITQKEVLALAPKLKLVPRQVQRCAEMALLAKYPKEPRELKQLIKSRLFEKNYEGLAELDPATQRELLNQAYETVVEDYRRILDVFRVNQAGANADAADSPEEEPEEEPEEDAEPSTKRARLSN